MPIVLNKIESTEVRIFVIATTFDTEPNLELQQLVAGALLETNLEVCNYVITTFKVNKLWSLE